MKRLLTYLLLFSVSFARAGEAEPVVITEQARQRASDLLSRMTLRQKCILISGIMESGGSGNKNTLGACPELGVPPVLMVDGPQGVSNSRRTKPSTYYACGVSLAATFDREAALRMGDALGLDARARGAGFLLGPGVNIYRTALCGRNFEYYSEAPLVAGMTAAACVLGVQKRPGVGATIKHYAVNSQENNRMGENNIVSERALREIYLKNFEIAVETSQPMAIMTSYNRVNGTQTANSYDLVTAILRDEWGFDGLVMTDWGTTGGMMGFAERYVSYASQCVYVGNDLTMPGVPNDADNINKALSGEEVPAPITLGSLVDCAERILQIVFKTAKFRDAKPYDALLQKPPMECQKK